MGLLCFLGRQFLSTSLCQLQAQEVHINLSTQFNTVFSVEGLQLDYPFLNFSGYIFYSICYTVGFWFKNNPFNNYGFGTVGSFHYLYPQFYHRSKYKILSLPIMGSFFPVSQDYSVSCTS